MDTNNVAAENVVETETTQANSPQAEAPLTGEQTTQGETVQPPVVEDAHDPVTTEEQRRAFQEMRQENKRLKEEMEARKTGESAFNTFRVQTPPVSSAPVQIGQFTDPVTGETDWQGFNQAQQQREQQLIQQAKFEAQQTTQELFDENNARQKFPNLFADPEVEQDIADKWIAAKLRGQNVSVTQIAEGFARKLKQTASKAEKVGAERILNEVSDKEKAGLTAQGQSTQGAAQALSQEEAERLRAGTRGGNQDAITARISKIPWANR